MNKKFKKAVATGLAAASLVTAGGVAAKQIDKKIHEKGYTVQSGDTLYDIANKYYGDGMYYDKIANYNNIKNPDEIKVGDVIVLPGKVDDNVKIETVQTYTIAPGDNLISICEKFYNVYSYETAIRLAKYNDIENPDKIKAGQTIKIPEIEELLKINIYPYDYEYDNERSRK